jgi:hypothetical protein
MLHLAVNDHYMLGGAGLAVERDALSVQSILLFRGQDDEGAVWVCCARYPILGEMYRDLSPGVLPAANGLICLLDRRSKGGLRGGGRGREGG